MKITNEKSNIEVNKNQPIETAILVDTMHMCIGHMSRSTSAFVYSAVCTLYYKHIMCNCALWSNDFLFTLQK